MRLWDLSTIWLGLGEGQPTIEVGPGYPLLRGDQTCTCHSALHPQGLAPNGALTSACYIGLDSIPVINIIEECEKKTAKHETCSLGASIPMDVSKSWWTESMANWVLFWKRRGRGEQCLVSSSSADVGWFGISVIHRENTVRPRYCHERGYLRPPADWSTHSEHSQQELIHKYGDLCQK